MQTDYGPLWDIYIKEVYGLRKKQTSLVSAETKIQKEVNGRAIDLVLSTLGVFLKEESQYFYLPAIGYYINGKLCDVGATGYYWTSRADELGDMIVYNLSFDNSGITMQSNDASLGYRVQAFE